MHRMKPRIEVSFRRKSPVSTSVKTGLCNRFQLFGYGIHTGLFSATRLGLETKRSVYKCEQRVVTTASYVYAGMDLGPALLEKNVAGLNELTVGSLRTKALGLRVTAVLGGTNTLLMSE